MSPVEMRAKAVSDVLKAYSFSINDFFAKSGLGLFIPAYQRPYSWDKSNIFRLIEDVSQGFRMLVRQPDTVTFLGTIIAVHDIQHKTISPLVEGELPSRVMTVIDGQQRLSTILILSTVFHDYLRVEVSKLSSEIAEEDWLYREVQRHLAELQRIFEFDQGYGDLNLRYYPRMIRAFVDQWSTQDKAPKNPKYFSPIAWYLHMYGMHVRKTEANPKKFVPNALSTSDKELANAHDFFLDRVKTIQKKIRDLDKVGSSGDEELELPNWPDVLSSVPFQQTLGNQVIFPKEVKERLSSSEESVFHRLLRNLLFSKFLLTRVALTVVEASNEDSAFDLFEALNTTGEPLTAYETFKPKVIQQELLENFEISQSHEQLRKIDAYLSEFKKTDDKQDATRNLVVAFALAETGEKLSRHLSDQRRYLRDQYEFLDAKSRLAFVEHLAHSASFHLDVWPKDTDNKPSFGEIDGMMTDMARLCIDFLRQSNHTITIAPLIRFYSSVYDAHLTQDLEQVKKAVNELENAIKAFASFWTLWRSSRPGTEGIDAYYRDIMKAPSSNPNPDDRRRFLSLSRRPDQKPVGLPPSSSELRVALCSILRKFGNIKRKEDFISRAIEQRGSKAKAVTRFLLLAALHDSPADSKHPGLNEKGTKGSAPLLNFATWHSLQTLEHIAPEKQDINSDWNAEIYRRQNGEFFDTIGNLTLLPQSLNASLSNRSWKSKQFLYKILASQTEDGRKKLLAKANEYGISEPTQLLQEKSTFMGQITALAAVEGEWTADLVEKRGKRLASLAWDQLSEWLKFDDVTDI